jgi:hypothetical protein
MRMFWIIVLLLLVLLFMAWLYSWTLLIITISLLRSLARVVFGLILVGGVGAWSVRSMKRWT